ncbi:MAG TPA: tetratricopeptide repeat protein [Chitinophagaceae bacterium]
MSVVPFAANAQQADKYLYKGNEFYRKGEFDKSLEQYQQALKVDPKSTIATFNQGNAQFRKKNLDEAVQSFSNTIETAADKGMKQQGYYNQGVAYIKQSKLEESIDSWKNALKLDPTDSLARENLQKALSELKKKQDQQKQQQKKNKDQQQQEKDKQQPPPQSKLSKQRVEQLLKALQQKEKEVQDRLQKEKVASPRKPDKDW